MREIINKIRVQAFAEIDAISSFDDLDRFRLIYLIRKGKIAELFDQLRTVPPSEKPVVGKLLNELRSTVQAAYDAKKQAVESKVIGKKEFIDLTIPVECGRSAQNIR